MKKQDFRILSLLLVALMLCTMLLACSETPPDDGTETPGPDENPPPDESPVIEDYLLEIEQENFGGTTINILTRDTDNHVREAFVEEEEATNLLEHSLYARNARVEEYLGVEITATPVAGGYTQSKIFIQTLQSSVAASDNAYQLAATHMAYNSGITLNDQYYNLRNYEENINLEASWWVSTWIENATVYGKTYYVLGDISLSMWEDTCAIFFNRQMATDNEWLLGNLYDTVRAGDWTIEELAMLVEAFYTDDGDDVRDVEDTYGMPISGTFLRGFLTSSDLPIAGRNAEGGFDLVFMDEEHNDRVEAVYSAVLELTHNNEGVYFDGHGETNATKMFTAGRALFLPNVLSTSDILRASEIQFGILPYPKYDESQTYYRTHMLDRASSWAVPLSCADPAMSAKVLDAMSAESKQSVIPVYYEIILQGRVAQDAESVEVLDMLRENLYLDFGFMYSDALRGTTLAGPFAHWGDSIENQTGSFATAWAERSGVWFEELRKAMDIFKEQ